MEPGGGKIMDESFGGSFAGAELSNADFRRGDFQRRDFTGANLREAIMAGANFAGANFANADLENADFSEARLLGANFRGARVTGANFRRATLIGAAFDPGAIEKENTFGAAMPDASLLLPVIPHFLTRNRCVAWSETADLVFTGHLSGDVSAWETRTGRLLRTWRDPASRRGITSIAYAAARHLLVTGNFDGAIHLRSLPEGKVIATFAGHAGGIQSLILFSGEALLASSGDDATIRIWDLASGREIQMLRGHNKSVRSIAISPNGRCLASCSRDGSVKLWDRAGGCVVRTLQTSEECLHAVAFNPSGSVLASGGCDGPLRFWNPETGEPLFVKEAGPILSLEYNSSGNLLAAGGERGASVLNASDGGLARELKGAHFIVSNLKFDPTGRRLAEGGESTGAIWNAETGANEHYLAGHLGGGLTHSLAVNTNGNMLAVKCSESVLSFWDLRHGGEIRRLTAEKPVRHVAFSETLEVFATIDSTSTLKLWSASGDGELLWSADRPGVNATSTQALLRQQIVFDSGRSRIAVAANGGVALHSLTQGKLLQQFRDRRDQTIECVAIHPRLEWIASGAKDGRFIIWDIAEGTRKRSRSAHTGGVHSLTFSPDGQFLATAGEDKTIRIWEVPSGRLIRALEGHQGAVSGIVYDSSGNLLASASEDQTVRVWEVATGRLVQTMETSGPVERVVFGAGGDVVVGCVSEEGLRIWETRTGRSIALFAPLPDGWVCCAENGRYRHSGNVSKRLWHVVALCRFDLGELDELLPHLKLGAEESIF